MILRKKATVLAFVVGLALFALSAFAPSAMACRDLHKEVEKYQSPEATDKSRQAALHEMARQCRGYIAVTSDELLLDVLNDALRRSYDKELVQDIFSRYRCIPGVTEEEGYSELTKALDTSACPTGMDLLNWFVVAVNGAFLRSRATQRSKRAGYVERGVVVEKLGQSGEWLRIRTWRNQTGYIHESLLAIY